MVVLKVNDREMYVKGIDDDTDYITFTTDPHECEDWGDDWRAGTRIQFLKTHVSLDNIHVKEDQKDWLEKLFPYYVDRY